MTCSISKVISTLLLFSSRCIVCRNVIRVFKINKFSSWAVSLSVILAVFGVDEVDRSDEMDKADEMDSI